MEELYLDRENLRQHLQRNLPNIFSVSNGLLRSGLLNLVMHSKLPGLASGNMKTCNDATSKTLETKDMPKKKNNK